MKTVSAFAAAAFVVALSASPVFAAGLMDEGANLMGGGTNSDASAGNSPAAGSAMNALTGGGSGSSAASALAGGMSMDSIKAMIEKQGFSQISGISPSPAGNALQASAMNSTGSPVSLLVNPTSGKVLSAIAK